MPSPDIDVALIHVPYAPLERPAIGLGLLQAGLELKGIQTRCIYANLDFASRVGMPLYQLSDTFASEALIGEWTFSKLAFPEFEADEKAFFELHRLEPNYIKALQAMRRAAEEFLHDAADHILKTGARIIGAGSTFQQHCASLAILRRLKELRPEVYCVMGGANCEGPMGAVTASFPWIDFVVSGEADLVFPDLCEKLLAGEELQELPESIFWSKRISTNSVPREKIRDLDCLPSPSYEDYFNDLQLHGLVDRINPGLPIETSRGCWWGQVQHCTFCGLNGSGMNFRSKSPERVLSDFKNLAERYDCKRFLIVDNILDHSYFKTVLPRLAEAEMSLDIFVETKANLRREHLETLAQAGVKWVLPGVESLHDELLKLMSKGSTALGNLQLLKWAREFGVRIEWSMLCHFPGESDSWYHEMAEWLPLVFHLQPPHGGVAIRYDRFSPYQTRPDDFGIKLRPAKSYEHIYPLEREALERLAYYFEDDEGSGREQQPTSTGIARIRQVIVQWLRAFYGPLPPILAMTDHGDHLTIFDTRPCARERRAKLEGSDRDLYLACDRAQTAEALSKELGQDCSATLESLCGRGLLLKLGRKYLALAVAGSVPTLPGRHDFPGGHVKAPTTSSSG